MSFKQTIITIFIFASLLLSAPQNISAVGGTCSWHNGINCTAGRDWDGSVICNDGWHDSSEKYSDHCSEGRIYFCDKDEYEKFIGPIKTIYEQQKKSIIFEYNNKAEEQQQQNSNYMAYLKANLIKQGVSPGGSSYLSVIAGQEGRNQELMTSIENERNRQLALADADYIKTTMNYIYSPPEKEGSYYRSGNGMLYYDEKCSIPHSIELHGKIMEWYLLACPNGGLLKTDQTVEIILNYMDGNKDITEKICEENTKKCDEGYLLRNNKCMTYTEDCQEHYGNDVYGEENKDKENSSLCHCRDGYEWNDRRTKCVEKIIEQALLCPEGYVLSDDKCVACNDSCVVRYGVNSYWAGESNKDGDCMCGCNDGYEWDSNKASCIKTALTEIDKNLSNRLKGKILLQIENNGEAYYVYPDDGKKYYLGRPADAFNVMRKLGLGVTHDFLTNHTTYPDNVLGKILIDVEQNGEAYYIYPKDKKAYYLGRPADAFKVMRELGLGITNNDLSKILKGSL